MSVGVPCVAVTKMQSARKSATNCPMSAAVAQERAFTLLELLIVIGILGLLIGLTVPGLTGARAQAKRVRCLANLHALSSATAAYAADDPRDQALPVHPIADLNELHDEGFFDYGGTTGSANVWGGKRFGPHSERGASTRPLNHLLFTSVDTESASFDVFRCPSDLGIPDGGHTLNRRFWDIPMRVQPMFVSVGTSYIGNAYRARTLLSESSARPYVSIGLFLRSQSNVPAPSSTVLLSEAVMWYNATAPGYSGRIGWQRLAGWHSGTEPEYNVAFADGHSQRVTVRTETLSGGSDAIYDGLYFRTGKFRFDCFPAPPIEDPPQRVREP